MTRGMMIVGVAGVLLGLLVGFLWWGNAARRMEADLRALQEQQAAAEVAREKLKGVQTQLELAQDELRAERERRSSLEGIVSQGRK